MTVTLAHLADGRVNSPQAQATAQPGGPVLTELPHLALPAGWNQAHTTVRFLVPLCHPLSQPDCSWTDSTLRLDRRATRVNTGGNLLLRMESLPTLWFSGHGRAWTPIHGDLLTYIRVFRNRSDQVR